MNDTYSAVFVGGRQDLTKRVIHGTPPMQYNFPVMAEYTHRDRFSGGRVDVEAIFGREVYKLVHHDARERLVIYALAEVYL